jgi:hypothetical protein
MIGDREFRVYLDRVRDGAVAAVMRLGRFERSGDVRLTVLRLEKVMIAYRTPFNPLPPLSDQAKYAAVREGKSALLEPYGIDVWQENYGRVLSIGWRGNGPVVIDLYRAGRWERLFDEELIREGEPDGQPDGVERNIRSPNRGVSRPQKVTRPA